MKKILYVLLMLFVLVPITSCKPNKKPNPGVEVIEYVVSFETNGGSNVASIKVLEGEKAKKPNDPVKEGYDFGGWYSDSGLTIEYSFNEVINSNLILYAKWNEDLSDSINAAKDKLIKFVDDIKKEYTDEVLFKQIDEIKDAGLIKLDNATDVFGCLNEITDEILEVIELFIDNGSGSVVEGKVEFISYEGLNEACAIEFSLNGADSYNVYVKGKNYEEYTLLDYKNAYYRKINNIGRFDLIGFEQGDYFFKVVPVLKNKEYDLQSSVCKVSINAYDRSGYAHYKYNDGVGAYNDNGTLKDNAIVIYVTDENKDTVMGSVSELAGAMFEVPNVGGRALGIGWWLNNTQYSKQGSNTYTTNGSKLGFDMVNDEHPIVIRFVGTVTAPSGLTAYDSTDFGGTVGDNGNMARMKDLKNVTLEGVGYDAVIEGWGFHFISSDTTGNRGKSFEARNLTFTKYTEDALGMEGVQEGGKLTSPVERCWIHHITFLPGYCANPAESDKSEGDGSCDFKRGMYYTMAYCYYEYCHKTNLIGSSDDSLQFNISFHHNIWYNCGSRIPLLRQANVHFYNNYVYCDINDSKAELSYVASLRANCYMFAENNYFEGCKNVYQQKSGVGKSFGNSYVQCYGDFDCSDVSKRDELVSSSCGYNGTSYANFDTNSSLFYYDSINKKSDCYITDSVSARLECLKKSGSYYRTILNNTACSVDRASNLYEVTDSINLSDEVLNVTIGTNIKGINFTNSGKAKFKNQGVTFRLADVAFVTMDIVGNSSVALNAGYLISASGEVMIVGSGSAVLNPGVYYIASCQMDKESTLNSLSFERVNSDEFDEQRINEYNDLVSKIPSVSYTDDCYKAIKVCMDAYMNLGNLQESVDYVTVENAYNSYLELGCSYVEELINNIGVVNENSGASIVIARKEYDKLIGIDSKVVVSNYNVLVSAEASFEGFAVNSCISRIADIDVVSLASGDKIILARTEYDLLTDEQKKLVTNYDLLVAAEVEYNNLVLINEVNDLIANCDLNSIDSIEEVINSYNELSSDNKKRIKDKEKYSNILVTYVIKLIDNIGVVTNKSGDDINKADNAYNNLLKEEKELVTNYEVLVTAKEVYSNMVIEYNIGWSYSSEAIAEKPKTGTTKDGFEYNMNKINSNSICIKQGSGQYVKSPILNSSTVTITFTVKAIDTSNAIILDVLVTYTDGSSEVIYVDLPEDKASLTKTIELSGKEISTVTLNGSSSHTSKNVGVEEFKITYFK